MSLKPQSIQPVPPSTAEVARMAFPKGNPYLTLRDELGTLFTDQDFADLFPARGQPALAPWRLALVTILQFRENLSDRQAAEAVRSRIDWKYLLGLELTDPGFDFSVLSEFRGRLISGQAEARLLDRFLADCQRRGLVKAGGRQRTDSTHVIGAVRQLKRLELVGETLRAALNELAVIEPEWLQQIVPTQWYERYERRIEDSRLPKTDSERDAYAQTVGEDGLALLGWIDRSDAPMIVKTLPQVQMLRTIWPQQYHVSSSSDDGTPTDTVQFKALSALDSATTRSLSPYDQDVRYGHKRDQGWVGYRVHLSESCDDDQVHLITHVETTLAPIHDINSTQVIHNKLKEKGLVPGEHLVDSAYVDANLLVQSQADYAIQLIGPTRPDTSWQAREGGYTLDQFMINWETQQVHCPQGKLSTYWREYTDNLDRNLIKVRFSKTDCDACEERTRCTRSKYQGRDLNLHRQEQFEALSAARERLETEAGQQLYAQRAGVEGTISQGVRAFGLRRSRYRGMAKTHLQQVITAVAMNIDRLMAWFEGRPLAKTRVSRFAALAA